MQPSIALCDCSVKHYGGNAPHDPECAYIAALKVFYESEKAKHATKKPHVCKTFYNYACVDCGKPLPKPSLPKVKNEVFGDPKPGPKNCVKCKATITAGLLCDYCQYDEALSPSAEMKKVGAAMLDNWKWLDKAEVITSPKPEDESLWIQMLRADTL